MSTKEEDKRKVRWDEGEQRQEGTLSGIKGSIIMSGTDKR
jgi:hypothetical protein